MKNSKTNIGTEIGIFIVLLIVVILLMAGMLYDYVPRQETVLEPISYSSNSATTTIKQEISRTNGGKNLNADNFEIDGESLTSLKSYSIEKSDLKVFSQKNLYNKGNSNPFEYAADEETKENGQTTEDKTVTQGTKNNSTTGTFFEKSSSK